ncbi:hypothetical protein ABEB36_002710 [Hypothenemus hampei]|uniref:Protein eyes shut homolog n=1 Tax=Hypothenemus hampei TaxID=57062 RepID=A0ABD1F6R8_HYPHA
MSQTGSTGLLYGLVLLLLHVRNVFNGFACLSNPCVHGICLDDLNSTYFCYCIDGYTGLQCQTNWNDCWSAPCLNGGECVDGIASFNCTCPPGFIGDLCEEDFNECESNPCWNNGTCVDGPNGYFCQCLAGYSGIHCEIDIAVCNITGEPRCKNAGVCIEGPGDTFSCNCQPGWEGFLCDLETNECISAPCQNGAVCIDLHSNYECACLFGYTGRNCEEVVKICNKNPCKNGALCLIEDGISVCYCVPDFHGELCEYQYDECQLGPRCLNGGTCIDGIDQFTCSCPPYLTGVLCECLLVHGNQLDCNYINHTTTIDYFPNSTVTIFETESTATPFKNQTTGKTITATVEISTITTPVPNITIQTTELSTVPYCVTQTSTTKESSITISTKQPTSVTTLTPTSSTASMETVTTLRPMTTLFSTTSTKYTTEMTAEEPETTTAIGRTSIGIISSIKTDVPTRVPTTTELISTVVTLDTRKTAETTTNILTTFPLVTTATSEKASTTPSITETTIYTTEFNELDTTTIFDKTTFPSITIPSTSTEEEISTVGTINWTTAPARITTEESKTLSTFVTTESTTQFDKETNRTFPEGSTSQSTITTVVPSATTFFTEEPTGTTRWTNITEVTSFSETTTISPTISNIDCTLQHCMNGGTCVFIGTSHQCLCPFDAEGSHCETKVEIKNVAFNGNSYLSHRLPSKQNISIEFEAKTVSINGLLFYTHLDNTYMTLYVKNGFLMFKFSCGFQTMLLSELEVPINNGFLINIKASLEFSKDHQHCDALVKINNTLTMSGNQMAKIDLFSKSVSWLHLGGNPTDNFISEDLPLEGFVGCISNLKISGHKKYIYKDAEDGFDVSECTSLACLSNPCQNGASCSPQGDDWKCHCRNGFLGKKCDISICNNNPCLFGGTCIPFTNSGYICLCPYGKHGHFCENELKISEPHFSSTVRGLSSFVAYPLPEGSSHKMEIKFKFIPATLEQISLLLFMGQDGQHDFYSDHLAVSFVKGYIMLTWNMGSGPRRVFTSQPIEIGDREYSVRIGYENRRAWLYVDNLGNITGRAPGPSIRLDVLPWLYLGGHHSENFSTLPHDLPLHSGFSGCIFDVELKMGNVVLLVQDLSNPLGRAVGQCRTTECFEQSCHNGGACLHHASTFMCLCPEKWHGPLCSSNVNFCDSNFTMCSERSNCVPLLTGYECDCSFGQVGRHCEKNESISDVSFTGIRSYLATYPFDIGNTQFNIEMEIRTLKDNGMISFIGHPDASFLCLSLQSGFLELRLRSSKMRSKSKQVLSIRSSKLILKGIWYKVQFGVFGRNVYVHVDHIINTGIMDHDFKLTLPKEPIYLGGLPDLSHLPYTACSGLPVPYSGCIRHFAIDEQLVILTQSNILNSRNVIDCDGTPCGGETCLNGGTCWLDPFMNPQCSCIEPYYGEKCEFMPKCTNESCKNGHCHNASCYCHIGFQGGFCETELTVKTPKFVGKSFLIVHKLGNKRRNADLEIRKLYVNFTTVEHNGMLIWTRQNEHFFGIGLEANHLKIAYSLNESKDHKVDMISFYNLSDGLWHNIELTFIPVSLKIDNKKVDSFVDTLSKNYLKSNGTLFIGGLPSNIQTTKETNGLFIQPFQGCIEAIGINTDNKVTNFMPFEGSNIENCNFV